MATLLKQVEQRVTLSRISWDTYERLLAEHDGAASPRFTYDRGVLEIMVVSFEHEEINRLVHDLFTAIADERGMDFVNAGSTTFRRQDLDRGFEPDTCFYVEHAARVRGKNEIDLATDPPPDLVIEIDITRPSLDKLSLYAALGVPEVWLYRDESVAIFVLGEGAYHSHDESTVLPGVPARVLSRFVHEGRAVDRSAWLRSVRVWARR